MKKALLVIGAFIGLAVLLTVIGALLPVAHTAAVRVRLTQPPPVVYQVVTEVARLPEWRSGVDSVRVLSAVHPVRWRESSSSGTIEFLMVQAQPSQAVVAEIQGAEEQGFGGSWTWELAAHPEGGTELTITERGQVYNPIFRLLSRTVFSPYTTLERYARDLGARLGDDVIPERVS